MENEIEGKLNMIKKAINILYKISLIILVILVSYVCYRSVFDIYNIQYSLEPIIIIIGVIVGLVLFTTLKKIVNKLNDKQIKLIAIVLCTMFFIGTSIFGNLITSIPTFDLSNILNEVNIMLENGGKFSTEKYFAKYTQQVPIAILIYCIYKIGTFVSLINVKTFAIIINCFFMAITAYFSYLTVSKLKNRKAGLLTLIFFILNPVFYLYSSYFYTDTLCMPFAAISAYLYVCSLKQENTKKRIVWLIISGLVLAIGFKIRVLLRNISYSSNYC